MPVGVALACSVAAIVGWGLWQENPQRYVEHALDIMQQNSFRRDSIDWPKFRESVLKNIHQAHTRADTYSALRTALSNLGDRHSFLMPPQPFAFMRLARGEAVPQPRGESINKVGYIWIPGFRSDSQAANTEFADQIQRIIARLDATEPIGWIVDLRDNTGGNMWPMLTGLGSILGEGDLGSFVDLKGSSVKWWYRNGAAGAGAHTSAKVGSAPYQIRRPTSPVAVLIGPRTSSSGEATAIAFRGRPVTRFFGGTTHGLASANRSFRLSDGALMMVTSALDADRTGRVYSEAIEPDEIVAKDTPRDTEHSDPEIAAALIWLRNLSGTR